MEPEINVDDDVVATQVSFGGFDNHVSAKNLFDYLEREIGVVWRCLLKTSRTPPESYPNFEITSSDEIQITNEYKKVEPHAFVHFASPESVTWAVNAAGKLFLNDRQLKICRGPDNPFHLNQRRRKSIPRKICDVCVEIGNLVTRDEFFVAWRSPATGVDFTIDPFDGTCKLCFAMNTVFSFKSTNEHAVIKCDFKIEFMVREIQMIKQYTDASYLVVVFQLNSAPLIWYRTADDDVEVSVPFDLLDDDDPWIRTTDFTRSGAIGRCNCYRILVLPRHGTKLKGALKYLREGRVLEETLTRPLKVGEEPGFGTPLKDHFFSLHYKEGIPFEVMFLVNAVLHKGIFNQHQLTNRFFGLLRKQPVAVNVAALKHISSYKQPVYDAPRRLKLVQEWLLKNPELLKAPDQLNDITVTRRLIITPTKAYCLPPEVEISNRVLRKYKHVADRFLRVTFMDEGMQTINSNVVTYFVAPIVREITCNSFPQKTRVFKRIKDILQDGFHLCGRRYSFLAFSSNQLRDRSAWFFAEDGKIKILDIKSWMGKFTNRNVAKCAARMGQCFSSTYSTVTVSSSEVNLNLPDIERNGYIFSDGIGTITPDLAKEVAEMLKLDIDPPCAYQIRYAGCKGVVACWPNKKDDGFRLSLRPSMNKFASNHTVLEVCSWTRLQPGFLNRQIITLLSTLKVPDEIFWDMQESMVSSLNQMLEDADIAFDVLTASCGHFGITAAIMLSSGFLPQKEPHLHGMLTCIRAAQLWDLREKARIFVHRGRWLMGCLDELGVLEHGQCFVQVTTHLLGKCFSKHGLKFSESKGNLQVIVGTVVIAKNPCLHPGDIRILEAIDAPELHHLYDCLIFPQKGDRPHANEASGSDLDGDLYFVTWDANLIPPSKKSWMPMQFDSAQAKTQARPVNHQDIIEFFARNMVNENLGTICNAHVVHADMSDECALDEKCITLAELAATAVDFPKTGRAVAMPPNLKPKLYPDFMGKDDHRSYQSNKILGRLYRQVKGTYRGDLMSADPDNDSTTDVCFDPDLEVSGSSGFVEDAWVQKCCYEGQLTGLLAQYKVKREEEVVTGHVWSMSLLQGSKKQGELKERLKQSYSALKKEFREVFENLGMDLQNLSDEEKNVLYEQKASAWYRVVYHPEWIMKSRESKLHEDGDDDDDTNQTAMLSFAWIAADYLVRIKIKQNRNEDQDLDCDNPRNALRKYLIDRMDATPLSSLSSS